MPQESGNLALLDTLMEFARPKDTAKSPMESLHEKIKKLTAETGKHLIDNYPIIREVIRKYVDDKEFTPLHEELVKLGKEANLWDAKYYVDDLTAAEPKVEVPKAAPEKEEVKKKRRTGMRRKVDRKKIRFEVKKKVEEVKQDGKKKKDKKAGAKDTGDSGKKAGKGKESGDKPKQEAAKTNKSQTH
eukprot:TRINITY_DN12983_c0_g8_i1.p1 TRINITY_DN12983_c0_g8~~TRINITY_DN12983_c0_g8_i1.p1  ORF type:complete len:187 (+),score=80.87 TRINITY_DN12983_c0_g8_i1:1009-1569(+)